MNLLRFARALLVTTVVGCAAVYPELGMTIRPVKGEMALDPPPPEELRWIRFTGATIPPQMRDGRTWQQSLGRLPNPYAKLIINDVEIIRTKPQSATLTPTWNDSVRGNFKVSPADKFRVELWDGDLIGDKPIGVKDFRPTSDFVIGDQIRIDVGGGAEVTLAFEPAHAMFGVGMWYELRSDTCFVTRLLSGSPAERAGILPGDEVVSLNGRQVSTLSTNALRTMFNSINKDGLPIVIRHEDGRTVSITLKEGPIYPSFEQYGQVD
ncbi:MAG: PDZ domain-containing protein [Polyangiaceae bacterium]|nr:PDZ domain-containing protein [Polyangiaceae bacterium]